jgi:hypothetical protein
METNVLLACILSFLAVFILLGVLAILIRLVTEFNPNGSRTDNGPVIAAIHTAAAVSFPEARVTRIEEIKK